jgi:hypothetical protein
MKNLKILLLLLFVSGCNKTETPSKEINLLNAQCPSSPQQKLSQDKVQQLDLGEQSISLSGTLTSGQTVGYLFDAKTGYKVKFSTESDLCTWLIAPDTKPVQDATLPLSGKYILQISPRKSLVEYEIAMSLEIPKESFNQELALDLVKQWYAAKTQIFSPPFDTEIVDKLTTGKLYDKVLVDDDGGSVGWLKKNDCYYTYTYSKVNQIVSFSTVEERPSLTLNISERLKINGSNPDCGEGGTKSYTKNVTYWFEQDEGVWKIYHYKVGT